MKDFKKYYILPATPEEVYSALTNPNELEFWTGDKVVMSTEPGSEFSLWDDSISGKNMEFEPGKKIVQEWYFGEQEERSEERRVGKECRSGWSPSREKKKEGSRQKTQ